MSLWHCGFESRLHFISSVSVIHFAVTPQCIMFQKWRANIIKSAESEVCFDCRGCGSQTLVFSKTILSHRGSLMHFNKLWSEGDDSQRKLDPSCWVISSALERTPKYLTHRWDLLLQLNSNFYKSILWGDTEALSKVDIQLRNSYVITTKLISIDGSNYLNEIVFLLNNDKQNYTLKFNRRNFE